MQMYDFFLKVGEKRPIMTDKFGNMLKTCCLQDDFQHTFSPLFRPIRAIYAQPTSDTMADS